MNDIELIYDKLKDKYNLTLTNAFALNEALHGMSLLFMVNLNKDGFGYTQMKMCRSHTVLNSFFLWNLKSKSEFGLESIW